MGLKDFGGIASDIGDQKSGMGSPHGKSKLGKQLFEAGHKLPKGTFGKIGECAIMLEPYIGLVPKDGRYIVLAPQDMERWKNDFFKNLVHGGPELPDDQFYTGKKDAVSNVGIGSDGGFTCEELFQFLYRLYKAMAEYEVQSADWAVVAQNADLFECAEMLEKYVARFPREKGCVTFEGQDAVDWKERFFPNLVEGGPKLIDYAFFNPNDKNYGIGQDGGFYALELFQFLYRLYKEIVEKLK